VARHEYVAAMTSVINFPAAFTPQSISSFHSRFFINFFSLE